MSRLLDFFRPVAIAIVTVSGAAACQGAAAAPDRRAALDPVVDVTPELDDHDGVIEHGICDVNPPPTTRRFFEQYEFKRSIGAQELKFGVKYGFADLVANATAACEGGLEGQIQLYAQSKMFGRELGWSAAATTSSSLCQTSICNADGRFCCERDGRACSAVDPTLAKSCETSRGTLSAAFSQGVVFEDRFLGYGKFAATGRAAIGINGGYNETRGKPTGTCATCCASGQDSYLLEGDVRASVEGKGTLGLKLPWAQAEVSLAAKGCLALGGKAGTPCDGSSLSSTIKPYGQVCIEGVAGLGGDRAQFRVVAGGAIRVCLPVGAWDTCFEIPQCIKTSNDPGAAAGACPQ